MTNRVIQMLGIGVVLSLIFSVAGVANATHLYTGHRFASTNIGTCDTSSLGNLDFGKKKASDAIYTARTHINGLNSKWTLGHQASDGNCTNHFRAAGLAKNTLGKAELNILSNGKISYANVVINKNVKWMSSGCTDSAGTTKFRLTYVLLHELGHWVEMKHSEDLSTVMYPYYKCDVWKGWHSHDESTIGSVYGT